MARQARRDTGSLTLGSAANGLLAYVFFALGTRVLGAHEAAPLAVLWSYWSFAGAALTFPIQHWIARTVVAGAEGRVRAALPRLAAWMVLAAVALGAVSWWQREALFGRDGWGFPVMLALVTLGAAAIGVLRGGLTARGRFRSLAWTLVAENGIRCVAGVVLAAAGSQSAVAFGVAMIAGYLVLLGWPGAFRFSDHTDRRTSRDGRSAIAFLSFASLGQLLGQVVLIGGPVVLAVIGGGPAEVTALFAGLAVARAPFIVAVGLAAQLTTTLTAYVVRGAEPELRRVWAVTVTATAAAAVAAAGLGGWIGPDLLQLVFGDDLVLPGGVCALGAAASVVAVGNLVLGVFALARNRPVVLAGGWVAAVLGGAVTLAAAAGLSELTELTEVAVAFLVAELVAFGVLAVAAARRSAGPVGGHEDR